MILVFLGLFIPQVNNYSQILVFSLYLVFLLLLSKENIQTETDIVKQSNSKSYLHKQLVNFSLIFEHLGTYYESISTVESNFLKSMSNALNYTSKKCLNNDLSVDFIKNQVLSILEGYEIGYIGKKGHPESEAVLEISDKIHLIEKEEEYDPSTRTYHETGYARWQCNNLTCEYCGHKELVDDDTFAEEWFKL